MEDKKVKASTMAVGICLFMFGVLLALIGMFVYVNITTIEKNNLQSEVDELKTSLEEKDKKVEELEDKISKVSDVIGEKNEKTELDKDSELVKKLYNIILKSDNSNNSFAWQSGFEPASCYRDIKTTFNTLTDMEKTLIILQNYNEDEINNLTKTEFQKISKETIEMEFIHDTVKEYKNLNEKALEIFNQENNKWDNYGGLASELQYIDNSYYLVGFDGGGKGTSEYGYAEIQKVEKDAENIYIYDKFIYVDSTNYDLAEGDSKIHIYTSADKSKDIGTESDIMLSVKDLYKKYENQLETYVHTFKQKKDGTYYWVSSEIYK